MYLRLLWKCLYYSLHAHTHCLSLSHIHTHIHTLSLSHIHTHTHTVSLSHTHTHTHTHSHTHSHTHTLSCTYMYTHSSKADALVAQTTQHTGAVRTLDVNPFQPNLLASGAGESEIFIWDLTNPSTPMSPGNKLHPLEDISGVAWNRQVRLNTSLMALLHEGADLHSYTVGGKKTVTFPFRSVPFKRKQIPFPCS